MLPPERCFVAVSALLMVCSVCAFLFSASPLLALAVFCTGCASVVAFALHGTSASVHDDEPPRREDALNASLVSA